MSLDGLGIHDSADLEKLFNPSMASKKKIGSVNKLVGAIFGR